MLMSCHRSDEMGSSCSLVLGKSSVHFCQWASVGQNSLGFLQGGSGWSGWLTDPSSHHNFPMCSGHGLQGRRLYLSKTLN